MYATLKLGKDEVYVYPKRK